MENTFNLIKKYLDVKYLSSDYKQILDINLKELGVDSLSIFGIITDLEQHTKKEIDFLNFDFNNLNTIRTLTHYINECEKL